MEFNKLSLKNLIKIVRLNKKNNEVITALDIKDLRFAKKKPLYEYMNAHINDFSILEEENKEEPIEYDNVSYDSDLENTNQPEEPKQEFKQEPKVIELNLDNIKNKKKPKAVPVPVIQESPEEIEAKNAACATIEKYFERFPWLREEQIDFSDPIRALKVVEGKVSCRNTSALISQNFFALCNGFESLAVNTPMINQYVKIQGFTQNLKASDAAQDVLDELIIKYAPTLTGENGLSVEARFGLVILGVLYQTHQLNSISDQVKNISSKPINRKFDL